MNSEVSRMPEPGLLGFLRFDPVTNEPRRQLSDAIQKTGFETISPQLKDHTERAVRRPPVWRIGKHQNAPREELCFD
jgi:hypothetical protein